MKTTTQRRSESARARGLAERSDLPWIDLEPEPVDPRTAQALSLSLVAEALAIPYAFESCALKVALADPRTTDLVEQAWDDGLEKALAGRTSVDELRRALVDLN